MQDARTNVLFSGTCNVRSTVDRCPGPGIDWYIPECCGVRHPLPASNGGRMVYELFCVHTLVKTFVDAVP